VLTVTTTHSPQDLLKKTLENCRQILSEVCTCGCRGTGNFKGEGLNTSSLASLRNYEKELQNELRVVRERIAEMESEEK